MDTLLYNTMIGLAAGDALGSTVEFLPTERVLPFVRVINRNRPEDAWWPCVQVGGGPFGWEVGAPTDDTDTAIALLVALRGPPYTCFEDRFIARMLEWGSSGPRDVGVQTRRGLAWMRGLRGLAMRDAIEHYTQFVVQHSERAGGNGAVMRNGAVMCERYSLEERLDLSARHTCLTHPLPMAVAASMLHTWFMCHGTSAPVAKFVEAVESWERGISARQGPLDSEAREWWTTVRVAERTAWPVVSAARALAAMTWGVESVTETDGTFEPVGGGAVPTLRTAYRCLVMAENPVLLQQYLPIYIHEIATAAGWNAHKDAGSMALLHAVVRGGDADTHGAVAGALLGARGFTLRDSLTGPLRARETIMKMCGVARPAHTD